MGAVFEGTQICFNRTVAIKILLPEYANSPDLEVRFRREGKTSSQIQHENVMQTIDVGTTTDGLDYLVLEYLQGTDLKDHLQAQPNGRLHWSVARDYLLQVAQGLQAVHDAQVIHRDIKPDNCFVTDRQGQAVIKILDFGIAKIADPSITDVTQPGYPPGTPAYMAPELDRVYPNERTDIYALGIMAYQLITGNLPFGSRTLQRVRLGLTTGDSALRDRELRGVPPALVSLIRDMIAINPEDRPLNTANVILRLNTLTIPRDQKRPINSFWVILPLLATTIAALMVWEKGCQLNNTVVTPASSQPDSRNDEKFGSASPESETAQSEAEAPAPPASLTPAPPPEDSKARHATPATPGSTPQDYLPTDKQHTDVNATDITPEDQQKPSPNQTKKRPSPRRQDRPEARKSDIKKGLKNSCKKEGTGFFTVYIKENPNAALSINTVPPSEDILRCAGRAIKKIRKTHKLPFEENANTLKLDFQLDTLTEDIQ